MPFVLLVLGLLGGGLVCLLVVNTTLGATSFRLNQLQRQNAKLSLQEQSLQGKIQNERAPQEIAKRAYQLGMRAETNATILDLHTGRSYKLHDPASALIAAGTIPEAPGTQGAEPRTGLVGVVAAGKAASGDQAAKHGSTKHGASRQGPAKHRKTATKAGSGR
jgi:hypothetical protein